MLLQVFCELVRILWNSKDVVLVSPQPNLISVQVVQGQIIPRGYQDVGNGCFRPELEREVLLIVRAAIDFDLELRGIGPTAKNPAVLSERHDVVLARLEIVEVLLVEVQKK
jgi:hypothetical protein